MAIDQGSSTVTINSQERTWRVNIETAKGQDPVVTAYREEVKTASDGTIVSKESNTQTQRSLSTVAKETQPFTPTTPGVVTGVELATLIADRIDMWRKADMTAKP